MPPLAACLQRADRVVEEPLGGIGAAVGQHAELIAAHLRHARPADSAFVPYLRFGEALLTQLQLDPELRELAILLVAARTGAEYEWFQHVGIARAIGVDDERISAVEGGELDAPCFDSDARVMLRFASEVLDGPRAEEETFTALSERFPAREIVELLLVIGSYQMLARAMTTLDIDIDEAVGGAVLQRRPRRTRDPS